MVVHAHHFTPDLNAALVEAIPLICRTKTDVLSFFWGSGFRGPQYDELAKLLRDDSSLFRKHQAVRSLLDAANENLSNEGLRLRREIIRRVTSFNNFASCWPDDQVRAKGAVQIVRELVQEKDALTRIVQAEERQRCAQIARSEQKAELTRKRAEQREAVKRSFFDLFSLTDGNCRGILFEGVLNRLFAIDGLAVREAFRVVGQAGEGVVEQIDGVIELDGHFYLVEAKWWAQKLGVVDVAQHTVRVASRSGMRGLYVVYPGYTDPAIVTIRDALQRGIYVLAVLEEVVAVLETEESIADWLRKKVGHAMIDRNPFVPFERMV